MSIQNIVPEVYYINMDKSVDRRQAMEQHLDQIKIPYFRSAAVASDEIYIPDDLDSSWIYDYNNYNDQSTFCEKSKWTPPKRGKIQDFSKYKAYSSVVLSLCGKKHVNLKELSTTISHLKAIDSAVNSKTATSNYALILEDDVFIPFNIDFAAVINTVPRSKFGILQLFNSNLKEVERMFESYKRNSSQLWDPYRIGRSEFWCAGAYIINREVLKPVMKKVFKRLNGWNIVNLLKFSEKYYSHLKADYYIYSMSKTYCLTVPLITGGNGANSSTLHQDHYAVSHVPFYRYQRSLMKQLLLGSIPRPSFVTPACSVDHFDISLGDELKGVFDNNLKKYPIDSLFFIEGVKVLQMDCSDNRFVSCTTKSVLVQNYQTSFNPSIVSADKLLQTYDRDSVFFAALRTSYPNCESYGIAHVNRSSDDTLDLRIQYLDQYFRFDSDKRIQVRHEAGTSKLAKPMKSKSRIPDHLYYVYPNHLVTRRVKFNSEQQEVVIGQDARLLILNDILWIYYNCYTVGCGKGTFIRIPVKIQLNKPHWTPYIIPGTAEIVNPRGRNQVFFASETNKTVTYMIHYLGPKLEIYNLEDSGYQVQTKNFFKLSHDWHMQGGMMIRWKTDKNNGHLGVAHKYEYYHNRNNISRYAKFGYNYVSAFFLISAEEPFYIKKLGQLFCFSSLTDHSQCDHIQFISGVLLSDNRLIISYGVNDCDGRLWSMSTSQVDTMLDATDDAALQSSSLMVRNWENNRRDGEKLILEAKLQE